MSVFASYRDPETRKAMVDFVCAQRGMEPLAAEAELHALNHVGLAYVHADMLAAQQNHAAALYDYDPLAPGRA